MCSTVLPHLLALMSDTTTPEGEKGELACVIAFTRNEAHNSPFHGLHNPNADVLSAVVSDVAVGNLLLAIAKILRRRSGQ